MTFTVTKTSDWDYEETVEIETLDKLLQFVRDNGPVIISRELDFDDRSELVEKGFELEIYDDYRE